MSAPSGQDLAKYERIVVDMDICIGCGACVSVCPYNALELDENGKARLIWEACPDSFECIKVCPVNCIWKASEAPEEAKSKQWYRFNRQLTPEEQQIFEQWRAKYGIKSDPIKA